MYDRSAELDFMLQAEGVPVVYQGTAVFGILHTEEFDFVGEGSSLHTGARRTTLTIRNGALTGLVVEAILTIDGAAYEIRDCGFARADGLRALRVAATDAQPDAPPFANGDILPGDDTDAPRFDGGIIL